MKRQDTRSQEAPSAKRCWQEHSGPTSTPQLPNHRSRIHHVLGPFLLCGFSPAATPELLIFNIANESPAPSDKFSLDDMNFYKSCVFRQAAKWPRTTTSLGWLRQSTVSHEMSATNFSHAPVSAPLSNTRHDPPSAMIGFPRELLPSNVSRCSSISGCPSLTLFRQQPLPNSLPQV